MGVVKEKTSETEGYKDNNFYTVNRSLGNNNNTRWSVGSNKLNGCSVEEIWIAEIIGIVD